MNTMNNITPHPNTILVLGGTGKTGRRIAERLKARGADVRIGSRSADPKFDWDDSLTWAPALRASSARCATRWTARTAWST